MSFVTVYGTTWSVASWDVRRLLDSIEIPFQFVDLDSDDEALVWVVGVCGSPNMAACLPVVKLSDGTVLRAATRTKVADMYGVRLDTGVLAAASRDRGATPGLGISHVTNAGPLPGVDND